MSVEMVYVRTRSRRTQMVGQSGTRCVPFRRYLAAQMTECVSGG